MIVAVTEKSVYGDRCICEYDVNNPNETVPIIGDTLTIAEATAMSNNCGYPKSYNEYKVIDRKFPIFTNASGTLSQGIPNLIVKRA